LVYSTSSKNRFRMSVLQMTTNMFVKEPFQNVRVTDNHEYIRQRTVTECPCYRWPRICSSKNCYRMSVLQMTTNMFVKELLQNVRVTDDHEYVPFAIVIIHSYSPLHDWSPNMTYHRNANTKNTTVVTIRAGFAYLSWAPSSPPVFRGVHVA
jgi:hypothetical protein